MRMLNSALLVGALLCLGCAESADTKADKTPTKNTAKDDGKKQSSSEESGDKAKTPDEGAASQKPSHGFKGPPAGKPLAGPHGPDRPADDAPVVKISSKEIAEGLEGDLDGTVEKYRGKWVEVTGPITMIAVTPNDHGGNSYSTSVRLRGTVLKIPNFLVREPLPWTVASIRDTVTIRGTIAYGEQFRGFFDHCTIIDSQGEPTPRVSADELAEAVSTDWEAAKAKFEGGLVITGALESIEGSTATFASESGAKVEALGWDVPRMAKPGEQVALFGECAFNEFDKTTVALQSSYRIDFLEE